MGVARWAGIVVFSRTRKVPERFTLRTFGYSVGVVQPYSASVGEAMRFCGESELGFVNA